jgi:protein-serine/threonine kinase
MNPNDHHFLGNDRNYPTTPSTFPQMWGAPSSQGAPNPQQQQQSQLSPAGYGQQAGYFSAPYQPPQQQYQQQPYQYQQPAANNLQPPQAAYQAQQQNRYLNDGTNGLTHQLSHQNLLGASRPGYQAPSSGSQNQRPRTAGNNGQNIFGNAPPAPQSTSPAPSSIDMNGGFEEITSRDPAGCSKRSRDASKLVNQRIAQYFKNAVARARDRNAR